MMEEYKLNGITRGIISYDPTILFESYDRMDLQSFVINLDLAFQYRTLSIDSLCQSLPKKMVDKIFSSVYTNLLPQYQISFLENVYVPLLLYLNKTHNIKDHIIVSPLQTFNINMLTFATIVSKTLNEIFYVTWYTELWTILDWDHLAIQGDILVQVQQLITDKAIMTFNSYTNGLHNIFNIDYTGVFNQGNAEYYGKSLIITMLPALAQQICDLYFSSIDELKDYVGLRGYNHDQKLELYDDLVSVLKECLL